MNPRVSTIFNLGVENEQRADAGKDDRTWLTRPNSQARAGTGKYSLTDHEQDRQQFIIPVDAQFAIICDEPYIHTLSSHPKTDVVLTRISSRCSPRVV